MTKIADTGAERKNSQFLDRRYWSGLKNITMTKIADTGAERKNDQFRNRISRSGLKNFVLKFGLQFLGSLSPPSISIFTHIGDFESA